MLIGILFNLLFFTVPLIFLKTTSELFEFNKIVFVYLITILISAVWLFYMIREKRIIFRHTLLDIPLLLFLFINIISTLTSIDQHTSLFGYYSRFNGGLLSLISYSILYWAYVTNMDKDKTLKAILFALLSTLLVSIWAIMEHFGLSLSCLIINEKLGVDCWVQDVQNRVFATFGQPNWLAAWVVALSPIVWTLSLFKKNKLRYHIIALLLLLTLLFTKSRSGILGFIIADAIFWSMLFLNLKKTILKTLFIFHLAVIIIVFFVGSPWSPSLFSNKQAQTSDSIISAPALETGGTESGEIRKIVWRGAIDIWKHYPLLGTGPETFAYSYYQFRPVEHNLTSEWDFLYNKAHNEYLNYAANTGTLGLLAYLALLGFSLINIYKIGNSTDQRITASGLEIRNLRIALTAGYVSILVTNFFGFSVVSTNFLLFLFPAISLTLTNHQPPTANHKSSNVKQKVFMFFTLLTTTYLLLTLLNYWRADINYANAKFNNDQNNYTDAIESLYQALKLNPNEPVYHDEIAHSFFLAGENASAFKEVDKAISISPRNLNFKRSKISMLIQLGANNKDYLQDAVNELNNLIIFAPTDARLFYNLGLVYARLGEKNLAIETLNSTLELKPDYQNAKEALILLNK